MKTEILGQTPTVVGNLNYISLTVGEYTALNPIPTNRDSLRRVPKMRKVFDEAYMNKQTDTLTEVAIAYVVDDFVDPETKTPYVKGSIFIVDGNTRKHYWLKYPERAKEITSITARIHYLHNMDDVAYAYYPYNNAKSTEKASEILQGLAKRYNCNFRQTVLANGVYRTAIDWASQVPGDSDKDLFEQFNYCFEGLKIIDGIPKDGTHTLTKPAISSIKSQSIIAAFLMKLRATPGELRIHAMIERLSGMTYDDLDRAILSKELDPVEIIAVEYAGQSHRRSVTRNAEPWLCGLAGSTKFQSKEIQLDFLLYWMSKYVENPKVKYNFNKGIKPSEWVGFWLQFFPEEEEA